MLYFLALVLMIAWLLSVLGVYSGAAYASVMLGVAVVLTVVAMLSGRRGLA
jgi:hypothetical protein